MIARFQWSWLWLIGPLGLVYLSARFWFAVWRDGATANRLVNAILCSVITVAVLIGVFLDLRRRNQLQANQTR